MIRICFDKRWLTCIVLFSSGCGAIPGLVSKAAKTQVKESLQEAVAGVVDNIIDDSVGWLLDFDVLEVPFAVLSDDDGRTDVFEDDNDGDADQDKGTGRVGGGSRAVLWHLNP